MSCSGNTARLSWHRLELVLYDTLTPEQEYNLNQQVWSLGLYVVMDNEWPSDPFFLIGRC